MMAWDEQALSDELSRHEDWLLSTAGVEGTGIGVDQRGQLCLKIYTAQKNAELEQQILQKLSNIPVDFETTGSIEAQ